MRKIKYPIRLDLFTGGNQAVIKMKKGEVGARQIEVFLACGFSPYEWEEGCIATFRAVKPDGTHIYNAANYNGNSLLVDITSNVISAAGIIKCELTLNDANGNVMYSPQFSLLVEDNLYDDSEVESTNEYSQLTSAISTVQSLNEKWSNASASAENGAQPGVAVSVNEDTVEFAFTLVKGDKGDAGVSVSVGTTTTGAAGTSASVTNSGTASDPVLNFTIPKGDMGGVASVDGVIPDSQGNVGLGAAKADAFSRNGNAAMPSGCKGFDVRPFEDGVSLGIGAEALNTSKSVKINDDLKTPFLAALGAQQALTVEDLSNNVTINDTYVDLANSSIQVYKYGRVITLNAVLLVDAPITEAVTILSGLPANAGPVIYFNDSVSGNVFALLNGALITFSASVFQYVLNLSYMTAS